MAIFGAFSLSLITHAQTTPFAKGQVADRIRKVEDGVDEFRKYLDNRGEAGGNRRRAAERLHADSVQIQRTQKLGETKPSNQKTISKMPWTI
jgi:hypothetical protein